MAENSVTEETYNSLYVRRKFARATLGWDTSKDADPADDHARACSLLLDSEFLPDREQVSLVGMICGTGCISIHLMPEVDESLARAELHYFSNRFYFFDPGERSQVWAQIKETVAPFPALAWRHGCLKAGLLVPRDVLAPLEDRVDLAAAIIQWSILPPQQAAVEIRHYAWQASENSRTMGQCWNDWYELQLKARPVALLTLPGIGISQRLNWISEAKLAKNVDIVVEQPLELRRTRSRWRLSTPGSRRFWFFVGVFWIINIRFDLLDRIGHRVGLLFQPEQSLHEKIQSDASKSAPSVQVPATITHSVETRSERDRRRGAIIISLLRNAEMVRRISSDSNNLETLSYSVGIPASIEDLKALTIDHSVADSAEHRDDQTVGDVGLVLPVSSSGFRCIGVARIDRNQQIQNAFWISGKESVHAGGAADIVEVLKRQTPLDETARLALQTELEQLTEIKVLVLTPEQFLATFEPPEPLDHERAAADQLPEVSPQPDAATQQD